MDTGEAHWQEDWREVYKNTTSYAEENLEPTLCETTAVRPLTSHL